MTAVLSADDLDQVERSSNQAVDDQDIISAAGGPGGQMFNLGQQLTSEQQQQMTDYWPSMRCVCRKIGQYRPHIPHD